ncbi:MAG TPA: hypothetical protein VMN99_13680 [Anaerolineales bacterium]|nr:hypothetical protein [Anaerolineales bacterium]
MVTKLFLALSEVTPRRHEDEAYSTTKQPYAQPVITPPGTAA